MKTRKLHIALIVVLGLAACTSNSDPVNSLPRQEQFALIRTPDGGWRIENDAAYYAFFNQIHENYDLLLAATTDPAEQRRLKIERDLTIARERLNNMANPEIVRQVIAGTRAKQGANPTGQLFRLSDVQAIPRQRFTPPDPENYVYEEVKPRLGSRITDSITAIIQFDRQLKQRGVQLIVVPVPNSAQVFAHKLHQDIRLEEVVWHPWAHMIVKLLEYDVEVIDLLDLYKTYSGENTVLNYIDHHWGLAGLEIVGQELARRLARFDFDPEYYVDPADIERSPIQVPMPALIPFWDKIPEGYVRSQMGIPHRYDTVRITHRGQRINPVPSFEDSPVLIMGDSFIPHLAEHSAGIYAHMAYHTGIIPAAFSRDAGAAKPPEWYRAYVAGKGREPRVVIWQIYGSAMIEINNLNDWMIVNMPEAEHPVTSAAARSRELPESRPESDPELQPLRALDWVSGTVREVSAIPALDDMVTYPDALYAFQLEVTSASTLQSGSTILVYSQFLENYNKLQENIVTEGQSVHIYLEELLASNRANPRFATMQLVDTLDDFESDVYFAHYQRLTPTGDLRKLQPASMDFSYVDENPALLFTFDSTQLLQSIQIPGEISLPAEQNINIETSLDGENWFSLYETRITAQNQDPRLLMFPLQHPATQVRITGLTAEIKDLFKLAFFGY